MWNTARSRHALPSLLAHCVIVLRFAPRYDRRVSRALHRLNDPTEPMAEVCRRVGDEAERLGVPRPSYVHARRILKADRQRREVERLRREGVRAVIADVTADLVAGRYVDAYDVAERLREAGPAEAIP